MQDDCCEPAAEVGLPVPRIDICDPNPVEICDCLIDDDGVFVLTDSDEHVWR